MGVPDCKIYFLPKVLPHIHGVAAKAAAAQTLATLYLPSRQTG